MTNRRFFRQLLMLGVAGFLLLTTACGYHTGGAAVRLPADVHTVYVPCICQRVANLPHWPDLHRSGD